MVLRRSLLLLIALLLPTIAFATTTYVVKKGDNLYDLSRKFGVSVEDIKTLNKLDNINLGIGDELLIPTEKKDGNNNYVVKGGDTLSQIADKFDVKTKDLKSANNLKNDKLQIGQSLYIPLQKNNDTEISNKEAAVSLVTKKVTNTDGNSVSSSEKEETTPKEIITNEYIVEKGDTLGHIAEKHSVKVDDIKKSNNLKNNNLQIGQKLIIPSEIKASAKPAYSPDKIKDSKITVSNVYIVKQGDTIYDLSNKLKITKEKLLSWNNLDKSKLSIGQKLYLTPTKEAETAKKADKASDLKYTDSYKVKSGDTLGHIAARHGISVSNLKLANNLTNNNLSVGKVLNVPPSNKKNAAAKKSAPSNAGSRADTKYTVKRGDTLGAIAGRYGVSVTKLKGANSLKSNNIRVGQVLLIPGSNDSQPSFKYKVVSGDTLGAIGKKFGVSVDELRALNNLNSNYLYAGMTLNVPGSGAKSTVSTQAKKAQKTELKRSSRYVVKSGESLGIIAQRFGISATSIKNANNMTSDTIRIGQIITIPGAEDYRNYAATSAGNSEKRVKYSIIETAKQYLGAPYKFGGYSFKTGIDCSGYVKKIFSKFNVDLPRTARDIYYRAGTRIAKSQLQTGDLVFFTTYARYPSHVGIYMGNGKFIHASSGSKKVTITSLDKDYYRKRYIGAKRIKLSAIFEKEYSQR